MTANLKRPLKWIAGALLVLIAGCATTPPPEFTATDFNAQNIDEIAVLSIIDHRIDADKELKLNKRTKNFVKKRLKKARYSYSFEPSPQYVAVVSRDGLEDEDPEMIAGLGPEGSRWLLLLVLHDVSSKLTFGSSGGAEMTGYIFDKENQTVVWRNKEFAEISQGGLMGMAMKGAMQISAIQLATDKILKGLPKREKE